MLKVDQGIAKSAREVTTLNKDPTKVPTGESALIMSVTERAESCNNGSKEIRTFAFPFSLFPPHWSNKLQEEVLGVNLPAAFAKQAPTW